VRVDSEFASSEVFAGVGHLNSSQ